MQRWVAAGYHIVMQPTVRLAEEGVLADLKAMGLLSDEHRLSLTAEAITVPPRVVADLSVRHLHPELEVMTEGHPQQGLYPPYRIWRVPNRRGFILHVFFGTPVLMDFAAVPSNHASCLERRDWESVYIGSNFSKCGGLYVVADSDEAGILSITPTAVNRTPSSTTPRFGASWMPGYALLCNLRGAIAFYCRGEYDVVRRDMFRASICWHPDDIDEVWRREESRIVKLIERAAGDYYAHGSAFPPRFSTDLRYFPLDFINVLQHMIRFFRGSLGATIRALAGNREDAARIRQKAGAILGRFRGRFRRH